MFEKLSDKDKQTLKKGSIALAVIAVLLVGMKVYGDWNNKTLEYKSIDSALEKLDISDNVFTKTLNAVPIFLMPKDEQSQKEEFRNSLDQLFDDLRITTETWQEVTAKTNAVTGLAGYGYLKLKTSGTCRFDQILDLLSSLKGNPYVFSVEELNLETDPQNVRQVKFIITLSTLVTKRGK